MTHDKHRKSQQAILQTTLGILRDDHRVLAVGISGSGARDEMDAFSDIDLGCYLKDEERSGLHEILDKVADQAPLLCRMWLYNVNGLFLYENGVRLDLDIHRPSALRPNYWMSQVRVLHDPDGVLARTVEASSEIMNAESPDPKDPVDWCFWMFRQIVCWTKRGAQGGYRSYDKLAAAAESLLQVRDYLVRVRLRTAGRRDYLANVDSELAQSLSKTFPRLEASEIIECTKRLVDEFERICPEYCRKIEVDFPAKSVAAMRQLIAEYEALE